MAFNHYFDLLEDLLDELYEVAEECGCPLPDCRYVALCTPPADCCDAVVAWMDEVRPPARVLGFPKPPCVDEVELSVKVRVYFCIPNVVVDEAGRICAPDIKAIEECSEKWLQLAESFRVRGLRFFSGGNCEKPATARLSTGCSGGCGFIELTYTSELS